jgi:hypothetical protein
MQGNRHLTNWTNNNGFGRLYQHKDSKAYILRGGRKWYLVLDNGQFVLPPFHTREQAWEHWKAVTEGQAAESA